MIFQIAQRAAAISICFAFALSANSAWAQNTKKVDRGVPYERWGIYCDQTPECEGVDFATPEEAMQAYNLGQANRYARCADPAINQASCWRYTLNTIRGPSASSDRFLNGTPELLDAVGVYTVHNLDTGAVSTDPVPLVRSVGLVLRCASGSLEAGSLGDNTRHLVFRCIENVVTTDEEITPSNPPICSNQPGVTTSRPISPATGQKMLFETDYTESMLHPFEIKRTYIGGPVIDKQPWPPLYNSQNPAPRIQFSAPGQTDWRWHHSIQPQLMKERTDLPTQGTTFFVDTVRILLGDGTSKRFRGLAVGGRFLELQATQMAHQGATWTDLDGQDQLLVTQDPNLGRLYTLKLVESDKRWVFDDAGRIRKIIERNGWVMSYAYDSAGRLRSITNAFGRQLTYSYNSTSGSVQLNLPDGGSIVYQGASVRFADNSVKTYLYENPSFPAAITGIVDENGTRFATYAYDSLGRAISSELAGGADRSTIQYPSASSISLMSSQSVGVTDALGTQRQMRFISPSGYLNLLSADKISASSSALNFVQTNQATGLPEIETDFLGYKKAINWDGARRLPLNEYTALYLPETQSTRFDWHPSFRLPVRVTSDQIKTTDYAYDARGNLLTHTETSGSSRTWTFSYSPQNLPLTMTDPRGQVWSYAYDAAGNRTSITQPLGHVSNYTYDGAGRMLTEAAPNGLVTSYQYDPRGRVTQVTRGSNLATPLRQITAYTYRPSGQIASASLPNGHAIAYTYDAAQRLIAATDNRGNAITYTLDAMGNRVAEQIKDANQQIALSTQRVINALNRVEGIRGGSNPAQQTTALQYDANGELIRATNPLGNAQQTTLDALRRPIATTLPDGSSATNSFNQLNDLTQVTDPKGIRTTYSKNAWGEILSEYNPDIGSISYTRDAAGNLLTMQDAKAQLTSYQYDALSRVTQINFADGKQQSFFYDGAAAGQQKGFLREMQDASGSTKYERDAFGRTTKKTQTVNDNPSAPTVLISQYTYTAAGDLASLRYPSGLTVGYTRSASGQISGITTKQGSAAVQPFVQNLSYTALGQPKAWSWAHCTAATLTLGPCTSEQRSFDADARMLSSFVASYQYDAASRITAITQNLWAQRSVTTTSGTTTSSTLQNYTTPISWAINYDNRDRITRFARSLPSNSAGQQAASSAAYTYDANSNRLTSIALSATDTNKDGLFQTSEQRSSQAQQLSVAAGSNRLLGFTQSVTTLTGTKTNSTVNSQVNYTLDANGNLISDGLRSFQYDASDRLSKVILGSTFVGTDSIAGNELAAHTYLHNAAGQRVFKSEPKTEATAPSEATLGTGFVSWLRTNYSWLWQTAQTNATLGDSYLYADGSLPSWALLGEYGNGGVSSSGRTEYIWLPTQDGSAIAVGIYRAGKLHAIHSDHLGTPRLITNETNTAQWQWPYSAFGDNAPTGILKPTTSAGSAFTSIPAAQGSGATTTLLATSSPTQINNLRFPGQYADSETGLFYNYYRSYQAAQGRYTQNDPIGLAGGWNRFGYADGSPTTKTDPMGLATYLCTQPLHALGKVGEWVYAPKSNALHHKFIGIVRPDGSTFTGGQDRAGKPWSDGKPSEGDGANGNHQCEKVADDNECLEQCLMPKMQSPDRPKYALVPGTLNGGENCQSWANKTVDECRKQCKARR
jgi:RHS repeat-associated protein